MAFYRFGEMTIDEAEIIAKDLGLKNGDPYEQVLVTTNGCRFELEDEHSIYVEKLDAKIWIDVLYGDTDNYRSNVFYWNDIYGDQIPENAIIIGDTQNNGFIVYIYSGLEKGIYYWDDSYAFDCSNKDCNAYRIANDIKSLFENLKITYRKLFARIKKCKPNIEFGEDNMLYRATGSEKIQTIDAKECKEITHKCNEFKIKFEFTRQYDIETVVLRTIKRVEDGTGYVFPKGIRNLIFDTNIKNIKRTHFGVFDDIVNTSFDIIKFEDFSYERNAWDINCSGRDIDDAIENGDFERARKLQKLHKDYVVFAYCEKAVNDFFAIEKSTNKIVAFNWNDLKIEKVADDFESFVNSFYDKDERSMQKADAQKANDKQPKSTDLTNKKEQNDKVQPIVSSNKTMKYYLMRYNAEQADKRNHITGLKELNNTMPDYSICSGKYVENWNPNITLVCDDGKEKVIPDWLWNINGWLVVSQRFVDTVKPFENGAIQYLPIKVDAVQPQMQGEKYYVANVIRVLDVVDYEKSDWFPMGPNDEYRSLINYYLKKDEIKDDHIFIIKDDILSEFVVVSEDVKNAMFKAKLLGFIFFEVKLV